MLICAWAELLPEVLNVGDNKDFGGLIDVYCDVGLEILEVQVLETVVKEFVP